MSFFFWDINFRKFIAKIKIQEKKKQQKYVLGENKTLRENYRRAFVLQMQGKTG